MSDLPRWHPSMVDEAQINALCEEIESYCRGQRSAEQALAAVWQLDQLGRIYGEKTARLRELLKKQRIPNLSDHHVAVYSAVSGIKNLSRMQNTAAVERAAEMRRFRVEPRPPSSGYSLPVVLPFDLYVDDRYHGTVSCYVTADDVDKMHIGSKSLSKRRAIERKINEHWHVFERLFPQHIEDQWKKGNDLSKKGKLYWSEIKT